VRDRKLWGGDDPLFPATAVVNATGLKFEAAGLSRRHWSNAGPIRAIFRDALTLAGFTCSHWRISQKTCHSILKFGTTSHVRATTGRAHSIGNGSDRCFVGKIMGKIDKAKLSK
jgi:hypothetical protein